MGINVKVTFNQAIGEAKQREGTFVCYACCERVILVENGRGCTETRCPVHPWIMIRGTKVVGTSA